MVRKCSPFEFRAEIGNGLLPALQPEDRYCYWGHNSIISDHFGVIRGSPNTVEVFIRSTERSTCWFCSRNESMASPRGVFDCWCRRNVAEPLRDIVRLGLFCVFRDDFQSTRMPFRRRRFLQNHHARSLHGFSAHGKRSASYMQHAPAFVPPRRWSNWT